MKRCVVVLLLLVSLFAMCSCSIRKPVCYYAYFKDSAFMLVYSPQKNTLYEITIPSEIISQYGRVKNIASIPDAMRSFAEMEESGFMLGTAQTLDAIREILDAMSNAAVPTAEDRLEVLSKRAADFLNEALISRMSSLCGTDMRALANVLKNADANVCVMDSSGIMNLNDAEFSQKYFKMFINQVVNK